MITDFRRFVGWTNLSATRRSSLARKWALAPSNAKSMKSACWRFTATCTSAKWRSGLSTTCLKCSNIFRTMFKSIDWPTNSWFLPPVFPSFRAKTLGKDPFAYILSDYFPVSNNDYNWGTHWGLESLGRILCECQILNKKHKRVTWSYYNYPANHTYIKRSLNCPPKVERNKIKWRSTKSIMH